MRVSSSLRSGNPTAFAAVICDLPIQGRRHFQRNKWPPRALAHQITGIYMACFIGTQAGGHIDAGFAEVRQPLPRNPRVRILKRRDDALDAGLDKRLRAWRRHALMTTWFQRNIRCCAASLLTRAFQRLRFCVRPAAGLGPASANDAAHRLLIAVVSDDDTADGRVRPNLSQAAPGQAQRSLHVDRIGRLNRLIRLSRL